MTWLKKTLALPAELATAIALEGRLLAWSDHSDGFIAITNNSLVSIDAQVITITPWSKSLQAKWDPPNLIVIFQGQHDPIAESRSWVLAETSQLPRAVRDRVTSAVVVDRVFELPNAGKVRFVARKDRNQSYWTAIADDQQASETEVGQIEIAQALVELRSSFGI